MAYLRPSSQSPRPFFFNISHVLKRHLGKERGDGPISFIDVTLFILKYLCRNKISVFHDIWEKWENYEEYLF